MALGNATLNVSSFALTFSMMPMPKNGGLEFPWAALPLTLLLLLPLALFFAGLLLAVCYAGFYLLFQNVVREQLDARLSEVAGPIIADIALEPEDKDVDLLDIPGEYFEVLDKSGTVLQRSKNLHVNLPVGIQPGLQTVSVPGEGELFADVYCADATSWRN